MKRGEIVQPQEVIDTVWKKMTASGLEPRGEPPRPRTRVIGGVEAFELDAAFLVRGEAEIHMFVLFLPSAGSAYMAVMAKPGAVSESTEWEALVPMLRVHPPKKPASTGSPLVDEIIAKGMVAVLIIMLAAGVRWSTSIKTPQQRQYEAAFQPPSSISLISLQKTRSSSIVSTRRAGGRLERRSLP